MGDFDVNQLVELMKSEVKAEKAVEKQSCFGKRKLGSSRCVLVAVPSQRIGF